jgi:hypothetical protein
MRSTCGFAAVAWLDPARRRVDTPGVTAHAHCFVQVDVFTDRVFGGNPLAAFLDATGLSDTEMQALADLPALSQVVPPGEGQAPVLAIHFPRGETSLRLLTTIATLGTPLDVTLQEIRVEPFFPADDDTAQVSRDWAPADRKSTRRPGPAFRPFSHLPASGVVWV